MIFFAHLFKLMIFYILLSPGVGQVIEGWDAGLDGTDLMPKFGVKII